MPAAEKQSRQQEAGRDHVRVFAKKEQPELESAVFGVVAADQLLLGLGQVERQPIALRQHADQKDQKSQRLIEDVPATFDLLLDRPLQVQRAGEQDHAEHRQPQWDLVADELSARAEGAQHAVFIVRRPAAENDPIDRQAGDRECEENADVQARGDDELVLTRIGRRRSERHHRERQCGRAGGDSRRQ